ncbi:hypothetical protein PLICRDRAFT_39079 [Plicaturopsis crispa FD-325 SS-3]|nr:hypothetical protein PLICRDRAFT_39079 [Plicaturopsis crispa FD-325 SS-3]
MSGVSLDFSIAGDELEQRRIALERNLQHTDNLSLRLSSAPPSSAEYDSDNNSNHYQDRTMRQYGDSEEEDGGDMDSVEYPRHYSRSFGDFDQPSHDAYSYRTLDELDTEGIDPYSYGSTAAHHASALTLSAGLGGRGGRRADVSISGAEYDPERPVGEMIANGRFSMFDDAERSRSKQAAASLNFDPLVVDDSAELDRVLRSGQTATHLPPHLRSPPLAPSSASSSSSDSGSGPERSRPKLSDALQRVDFSPKRPRSAQGHHASPAQLSARSVRTAHGRSQRPTSPLVSTGPRPLSPANEPTPKARKRYTFPQSPAPAVAVQPPTPSTAGSKFTKMARGLAREIEAEQSQWGARNDAADQSRWEGGSGVPLAQSTVRARHGPASARARKVGGRVHLPDVTGLTSAVESPMKPGLEHFAYEGDDSPREAEARLLATLTAVQTQLAHLESQNGISRRRVRELERELDACRKEVARERSRVMEREEVIARQRLDDVRRKGKQRAREEEVGEQSVRYKEVVEEKKALEALIGSLRTHLKRLTEELASHQQLLQELRTLREDDRRALAEKAAEVDRLREEVDRLAGEVEVLRGVVEDGLAERRAVREGLQAQAQAEPSTEEEEEAQETTHDAENENTDEDDEDYKPDAESTRRGLSPELESLNDPTETRRRVRDTNRTDRASYNTTRPFITDESIGRISVELEDRRSERSGSSLSQRSPSALSQHSRPSLSVSQSHRSFSVSHSRSSTPVLAQRRSISGGSVRPTVEDTDDEEEQPAQRVPSPPARAPPLYQHARSHVNAPQPEASSSARPSAPTPAQAQAGGKRSHPKPPSPKPDAPETPFPQIRGENLERLFFSAPEHNADTCTVCHRRRRAGSPQRSCGGGRTHAEEDEGYAEGDDDRDAVNRALRNATMKGKQREHVAFADGVRSQDGQQERLPPQTVLARVLRELEDDFTHYKSIYVELADQYKFIDAASNVAKRNVLARHLREVIDVLEQKGDQIASLYDLLNFKDKNVAESVVPPRNSRSVPVETASWGRRRGLKKHPTVC